MLARSGINCYGSLALYYHTHQITFAFSPLSFIYNSRKEGDFKAQKLKKLLFYFGSIDFPVEMRNLSITSTISCVIKIKGDDFFFCGQYKHTSNTHLK